MRTILIVGSPASGKSLLAHWILPQIPKYDRIVMEGINHPKSREHLDRRFKANRPALAIGCVTETTPELLAWLPWDLIIRLEGQMPYPFV